VTKLERITGKIMEVRDDAVIVVQCDDGTVLDIPQAEWPEEWFGPMTIGATYEARWREGHLISLPTFAWCQRETVTAFDKSRRGKRDYNLSMERFRPAKCRELDGSFRT